MRHYWSGLIACWTLCAAPADATSLSETLARVMAGATVPAMGVLTIRNDKIDAEAVRGVRRKDQKVAVKPTDVWHIGSNGKALTDTMIARLVERGILSWTKPLDQMLPELAPIMQPQYRQTTLAQLLSHHSGLPHDIADEKALSALLWDKRPGTAGERRYAYVARALQDPPAGPIGDFNYSNTGLLIASVVAERATHASYEKLMHREIFEPLAMRHVGFGEAPRGQPHGHINGRLSKLKDTYPAFFAPAGNMYMPLEDWARFCVDQLKGADGDGKLLRAETYRLMQSAQQGVGNSGIGWGVQPTIMGRRGPGLFHAGSDGTWLALVVLFPSSHSGALVTVNAGDSMGAHVAAKAVLRAVIADLAPPAIDAPVR